MVQLRLRKMNETEKEILQRSIQKSQLRKKSVASVEMLFVT